MAVMINNCSQKCGTNRARSTLTFTLTCYYKSMFVIRAEEHKETQIFEKSVPNLFINKHVRDVQHTDVSEKSSRTLNH